MFALSACAVPQDTPTATPKHTLVSTPTGTGALTPTPTVRPTRPVLILKGSAVFFATAGGVGCGYCHMPDARGFHTMPNIREAEEKRIRFALNGGVQAMNSIDLTEEEIVAVTAYLATLTEP